MRGPLPNNPTGSDSEALFDQRIRDKAFGTQSNFNSSSTVKVSRTSRGTSFKILSQRGGTVAPSVAGVQRFRLVKIQGDLLICAPVACLGLWIAATHYTVGQIVVGSDGQIYTALLASTGTNPVTPSPLTWKVTAATNVAKDPELRLSIAQLVIETILVTYSSAVYTNAGIFYRRDATISGVTEKQVVNPHWLEPYVANAAQGILAFTGSEILAVQPSNGTAVANCTWQEVSSRAWCIRANQST